MLTIALKTISHVSVPCRLYKTAVRSRFKRVLKSREAMLQVVSQTSVRRHIMFQVLLSHFLKNIILPPPTEKKKKAFMIACDSFHLEK